MSHLNFKPKFFADITKQAKALY